MNLRAIENTLAAREVGQFPLSIATSLALEGALGMYPERPPVVPPPILEYQELWINVRTLMRNLLGSLPPDFVETFQPGFFALVLPQEISFIETELLRRSQGMLRTVCYVADHTDLKRTLPGAQLRAAVTPRQIFHDATEREGLNQLVEHAGLDVRRCRTELPGHQHKALVMTHHPVDLLSRYQFRQLDLLESHTGIIKDPSQWYTKLSGGRELPPLPFNAFTLSLFGDNNQLLQTHPLKLRRAVLAVAESNNWSAVTTVDKIRHSLKQIPDPILRAGAQALL
jgi:hypothetical protein